MAHPRILLVDDDPSIVHVLELNFRLAGFTSDHAYRGEEAVERAAAEAPDAVILDIGIPGIDGFETARRIRALPGLGVVPLVFLTGQVRIELPEGLDDAHVLTKPFDLDEVVGLVRGLVPGPAPGQAVSPGDEDEPATGGEPPG